jgi:hypothetical protein
VTIDPSILCHPNIPKPLHGINPRTIYGKDWWDVERRKTYAQNDFHCSACGVYKQDALFHHWLEAHEFYLFDYTRGWVIFDHLVPLCHACHNFIHDGRMRMMVDRGDMSQSKYIQIINHGMAVLKQAGLAKARQARHNHPSHVEWQDWRMVVDGKEYGPSSPSFEAWLAGEWRNWRPEHD